MGVAKVDNDCCSLLALAIFAREHNCVRPELQDEPGIYIKAGRFVLQCVSCTFFSPSSITDILYRSSV